MPISIDKLSLKKINSPTSASDSLFVSSTLCLTVTYVGIDEATLEAYTVPTPSAYKRTRLLERDFPQLSYGMDVISIEVIAPDMVEAISGRCLQLTYAGKGSIRALLRSIIDPVRLKLGTQPLFQVNRQIMAYAHQLLINPLLSSGRSRQDSSLSSVSGTSAHELPARQPRPFYSPTSTIVTDKVAASRNQITLRTILHTGGDTDTYMVAEGLNYRRRLGDIAASIAEIVHLLTGGQSPRSTVFQDLNGNRCALGSHFNPDAVTVHEHLLMLSAEERRAFIIEFASDLGKCIAILIYINQKDFHLGNIMFDKRKRCLFIIDFDRCYDTDKYRNSKSYHHQRFNGISQCDLRAPFNPVDRYTDNWFYLHQRYLNDGGTHTLEKLQILPDLHVLMEREDFKRSYFAALYTCANLKPAQLYACTRQIANAQFRDRMTEDFMTLSQKLLRNLLSMPEFLERYQAEPHFFEEQLVPVHFAGGSADSSAVAPDTLKHKSLKAIVARIVELCKYVKYLEQKALTMKSLETSRGTKVSETTMAKMLHRAEVELKGIDILIQWHEREMPELLEDRENLINYKQQIIRILNGLVIWHSNETSDPEVLSCSSSEYENLLDMPKTLEIANNFIAHMGVVSQLIYDIKDKIDRSSIRESLRYFNDRVDVLIKAWSSNYKYLMVLEFRQGKSLFDLVEQVSLLSRAYNNLWHEMLVKIKENHLFSMPINDIKKITINERECQYREVYEQLLQMKRLLLKLRLAGLMNSHDCEREHSQLQQQMVVFNKTEDEARCSNGEIPMINDYVTRLQTCLNKCEPTQFSSIKATLSALIAYLQIPQKNTTVESKQVFGHLLKTHAAELGYNLVDRCLTPLDVLFDLIRGNTITLPVLPPSFDTLSLNNYIEQYSTAVVHIKLYFELIQMAGVVYQSLLALALITPEMLAEKQQIFADKSADYIAVCQQYHDNIIIAHKELALVKQTYDEASDWCYMNISSARPDGLEKQHQKYLAYLQDDENDPWITWLRVYAEGRDAKSQMSFSGSIVSLFGISLRDTRTDAYYDSFSTQPCTQWRPPS